MKYAFIAFVSASALLTTSGVSLADPAVPKSGTTPYTTQFTFVPKSTLISPASARP